MLFNSIEFAIFLPIVFLSYWFIFSRNIKLQNFFLLVSSYIFYGWWDWRFLSLLFVSSTVDYLVGIGQLRFKKRLQKKLLLAASISVNIGLLGFFKYFNFFIESFVTAFTFFGYSLQYDRIKIILPVGISFYTFQTLSYSIDVYKEKIPPTKDVVAFFAFVSFFPQLVAGPIERATNLLPQFFERRRFKYDKSVDGLRQILWGLFKKIVIADNLATYVDIIFDNYTQFSGSILMLGVFYFSIQIYCDFSGYSDIAIGTGKLFGFRLSRNFAFPYFSRDIGEFWRRWHISLSTWFRDYVYIPLGGSRGETFLTVRNVFIIFLLTGLWHGANWTFVAWGFINACYFLPLMLLHRNRMHIDSVAEGKLLPSLTEAIQIGTTFVMTLIAWVFFRSENIVQAAGYMKRMFSPPFFYFPNPHKAYVSLAAIFFCFEWLQRNKQHALQLDNNKVIGLLRWLFYSFLIFLMGMYMPTEETPFIYFQF